MDNDLDMFEESLRQLVRSFARPRTWEIIQRAAGISLDRPSAQLLTTLQCNAPGCKLHELAAKLGIEAPSVTRTVQRLEEEKLVVRTIDPADRRATYLRITRLGERTLKQLKRAKRAQLKSLFASWTAEDRKQLATLLHRLTQQITSNT